MALAAGSLKIEIARRKLLAGGVIAYPTESVWGLGCDPNNRQAVERLLAIKGRSVDKGLILIAASSDQLQPYLQGLDAQQVARLQARQSWPVTWVIPDNGVVPIWVKGSNSGVAVRVSTNKLVVDLCRAFGGPIISTSANQSGMPTPRWPWQVWRQLPGVDYCVGGQPANPGRPSEIKDLITDKVLRAR